MSTIVTVPLATLNTDLCPVLNVANGILPDQALAITCTLQFGPSVQAILIDLSESARKFNAVPIQGAFIDMSGSAIDMRLENPATGQAILCKATLQGYYNLLSPMPAKFIAVLSSAPAAALNITVILYNTVIESEVWGLTTGPAGATGPQGPPGATGATGPQGPAGTISPATATTLGGVKIGSNVNVLADGTISVAAPYVLPIATSTVLGGVKAGTGVSIAGDGTLSAPVLAPASNTVLGGVKVGTNVSVLGDGTISVPVTAAFQTPWLSNIAGAGFNLAGANQITVTGKIGVGTASPADLLDVVATAPGSVPQIGIQSTAATGANAASLSLSTATSGWYIQNRGTFDAPNNRLAFIQAGLEALTILPTGVVSITGAPGLPNAKLEVHGGRTYLVAINEQYALGLQYAEGLGRYYLGGSNSATPDLIFSNTAGSETMRLANGGGLGIGIVPTHTLQLVNDDAAKTTTNTWTIASGAKVKKNIKRLKGGLDIINKLSPTEAQYNGKGGTPDGQRVVSMIAEEVREILPHTVTEDSEGNLGFNIHEVIHHLVLAVQQLSKKLEKVPA